MKTKLVKHPLFYAIICLLYFLLFGCNEQNNANQPKQVNNYQNVSGLDNKATLGKYLLDCNDYPNCIYSFVEFENLDHAYASEIYIKILKNKSHPARAIIAQRFGVLGQDKVINEILEFINDPDEQVADNIKISLIKLNSKNSEELSKFILESNHVMIRREFAGLYDISEKEKHKSYLIIMLLHDTDSIVKQISAESLGKIGGKDSLEALICITNLPCGYF